MQINALLVGTAVVILVSGCTQQQQERISSSRIDKEVQETLNTRIDQATEFSQRTGDWLKAESRLRTLEFKVRRAESEKKLSLSQLQSVKSSTETIRAQMQSAISSGQGLDAGETDRILTSIKTVETRLEGLVAGLEKPTY